MHARLTTVIGATDIDAGVAFVRDQAVHDLEQQGGFMGMSCSADRAAGMVGILSLWATEADLDASESTADKTRAEGLKVLGGHPTVERYEQLAEAMGSAPPQAGSMLRLTSWSCDPSKIDGLQSFIDDDVIPTLREREGFRSIRVFVNRGSGQGMIGTVWSDDAAIEASLDTIAGLREKGTERGMTFGDAQLREVLFAQMR
jgi:heme-degrading monooxygenase HmoA